MCTLNAKNGVSYNMESTYVEVEKMDTKLEKMAIGGGTTFGIA